MPGVLTGRPREDREETTEADGGEAATSQRTPWPPAAAGVGVGPGAWPPWGFQEDQLCRDLTLRL